MKPLAGVRILEFDGLGPVTFAGMMLADLGAEVLRLTRSADAGAGVFSGASGEVLTRGRDVLPVDLKSSADRDAVLELVRASDALVEGFRPGVMERLGLGPQACQAVNAALVYGRVTGWGRSGPLAAQVGHDINYLALSGTLSLLKEPGRPPRPPLNLIADYAGGAMPLVVGVLSGIIEARTTGRGRVVDAAMVDGAALLPALFHASGSGEAASSMLGGEAPFYRCYECADGEFVAVGALEPRFYSALIEGLELDPADAPQGDPQRWPDLTNRFAVIFSTRTRDDWAARFEATEACVTPVLSVTEAREHPHNAAREVFLGTQPGPAPRFDPPAQHGSQLAGRLTIEAALDRWREPARGRDARGVSD